MTPAQGSRLDSWKEIASYLKRNERTVMRWAEERGLPVHRVPGGSRRTVFALTAEIDAWLLSQKDDAETAELGEGKAAGPESQVEPARGMHQESPDGPHPTEQRDEGNADRTRPRFRVRRLLITVGSAAAIAAAAFGLNALWTTRTARGSAAKIFSAKLGLDALEVRDAQGRLLWSHHYDRPFEDGGYLQVPIGSYPTRVADFFGDGHSEVVAGVTMKGGPDPTEMSESQLDFFSEDGKRLWSYVPSLTVKFGEYELRPPWLLVNMLVTKIGGNNKLYVAEAAHTWGNSYVAEIDPRTGKDKVLFVNTGVLYALNTVKTKTRTFLMAGGFNNEWDGAGLAIFDVNKPFAASPQTSGTRHECKSCPPGAPDYYFVFPRSEVNRLPPLAYNMPVMGLTVTDDGVQVWKLERMGSGHQETVYLLDREPPFRLKSMRFETDYQILHRKLSDEGKLAHRYEDCPELLHPLPVKVWTPASGWTEIRIPGTKAN